MKSLQVEIWSDVVCPWCYIGKRRFEAALAAFEHRDEVEVRWRSFQLDPDAPQTSEKTIAEMLAGKYGMSLERAAAANAHVSKLAAQEGLEYHLELAHPANTFNAHRLIHFAEHYGLQDAMKERLMRAYFTEGQRVGEIETLVRLASEVGLDAEEARTVLAADTYADKVRADERKAHLLGITGVPFFVINEKYGISGAQPREVFAKALEQVWSETHPLIIIGAGTDEESACEGDSCAVPSRQTPGVEIQ